eukprot:TRINITY_DN9420_c0_g1_i1.p1 TRINITY_DN9420_c0_g1~~TRINITY_DN9420_c0_g1_i1.p1  ORF type:complete len:1312 (+),score=456.44 TRINITY_DN9420_c0_g1_i1:36-3971(+)
MNETTNDFVVQGGKFVQNTQANRKKTDQLQKINDRVYEAVAKFETVFNYNKDQNEWNLQEANQVYDLIDDYEKLALDREGLLESLFKFFNNLNDDSDFHYEELEEFLTTQVETPQMVETRDELVNFLDTNHRVTEEVIDNLSVLHSDMILKLGNELEHLRESMLTLKPAEEFVELERDLEDMSSKVQAATKQLEKAMFQLSNAESSAKAAQEQANEYEKQLVELRTTHEEKLNNTAKLTEVMQAKLNELSEKQETLTLEKDEFMRQSKIFEQQNASLKKKLEDAKSTLHDVKKERTELETELVTLRDDMKTLKENSSLNETAHKELNMLKNVQNGLKICLPVYFEQLMGLPDRLKGEGLLVLEKVLIRANNGYSPPSELKFDEFQKNLDSNTKELLLNSFASLETTTNMLDPDLAVIAKAILNIKDSFSDGGLVRIIEERFIRVQNLLETVPDSNEVINAGKEKSVEKFTQTEAINIENINIFADDDQIDSSSFSKRIPSKTNLQMTYSKPQTPKTPKLVVDMDLSKFKQPPSNLSPAIEGILHDYLFMFKNHFKNDGIVDLIEPSIRSYVYTYLNSLPLDPLEWKEKIGFEDLSGICLLLANQLSEVNNNSKAEEEVVQTEINRITAEIIDGLVDAGIDVPIELQRPIFIENTNDLDDLMDDLNDLRKTIAFSLDKAPSTPINIQLKKNVENIPLDDDHDIINDSKYGSRHSSRHSSRNSMNKTDQEIEKNNLPLPSLDHTSIVSAGQHSNLNGKTISKPIDNYNESDNDDDKETKNMNKGNSNDNVQVNVEIPSVTKSKANRPNSTEETSLNKTDRRNSKLDDPESVWDNSVIDPTELLGIKRSNNPHQNNNGLNETFEQKEHIIEHVPFDLNDYIDTDDFSITLSNSPKKIRESILQTHMKQDQEYNENYHLVLEEEIRLQEQLQDLSDAIRQCPVPEVDDVDITVNIRGLVDPEKIEQIKDPMTRTLYRMRNRTVEASNRWKIKKKEILKERLRNLTNVMAAAKTLSGGEKYQHNNQHTGMLTTISMNKHVYSPKKTKDERIIPPIPLTAPDDLIRPPALASKPLLRTPFEPEDYDEISFGGTSKEIQNMLGTGIIPVSRLPLTAREYKHSSSSEKSVFTVSKIPLSARENTTHDSTRSFMNNSNQPQSQSLGKRSKKYSQNNSQSMKMNSMSTASNKEKKSKRELDLWNGNISLNIFSPIQQKAVPLPVMNVLNNRNQYELPNSEKLYSLNNMLENSGKTFQNYSNFEKNNENSLNKKAKFHKPKTQAELKRDIRIHQNRFHLGSNSQLDDKFKGDQQLFIDPIVR